MSKAYILFNPIAGNGKVSENLDILRVVIDDEVVFADLTEPGMPMGILEQMEEDDYIILCGGDGTLNRFANDTAHITINHEIFYYPCGTGNDFAKDFSWEYDNNPFPVAEHLSGLPSVTVHGKTYRFLNGVGFGIDGYCCQEGDRLRQIPGKKVNYTKIAIQGLLSKYRPTGATVCIDGATHKFKKVWIAPTMYGKYYGGGMIPAPQQKRGNEHLTLMVLHDSSKLRTLMIFPSIFNGTITKNQKNVSVYCGKEITVTFDGPRPLQIDGETILDVVSYTAKR